MRASSLIRGMFVLFVGMWLFPRATEAKWCERKAFLGVSVRRLSPEEKKEYRLSHGLSVLSVAERSPADKAGIEEGDILVEIDGEKMRRPEDLIRLVAAKRPGARIQIRFLREGEMLNKCVRLGRRPTHPAFSPPVWRFRWVANRPLLGIRTASLNEDLAPYFGASPDSGLLVLSVRPKSPAAKAGLKAGDVILSIEGETVSTPQTLRSLLSEHEGGDTLALTVLRKGVRIRCDVILDRKMSESRREGLEEGESELEIHLPSDFEWERLPNRF